MLGLGALWHLAGAAGSAQGHKAAELRASRIAAGAASIRIDGRLDEAFWREVPVLSGFRQREPKVGAPATEQTEVRVTYDLANLYVGILAHDSRPDRAVARILQRDQILLSESFHPGLRFAGDDIVAILLDPFDDRRGGFVFATNPAGAEFEALFSNDGQETNVDWRGVWRVAAARVPEGWSAEFAIPFRTLRYPSTPGAAWGFNVMRYVSRLNEESLWTSWSRDNEGFHRVSLAGHLVGLDSLPRSGLAIEAKPYFLAGGTRTIDEGVTNRETQLDAGIDLKWELTPGLLLDLTANTDFAQAEVDDEQVNLTRFDLFFPEKRDFFLENAGLFEFGWRSAFEPPPFLMFFSRRIGVSDSGEIPMLGGLRLTGRAGRQAIGVLNAVTDGAFGEPRTNHAVFRVRRDVGDAGYIGAMLTDRRSDSGSSTAGGIDWIARPTSKLTVQGFAAGTRDREGREGLAARVAADYASDRLSFLVSHTFVGPEVAADLGFVTRTDIHRTDGQLTLSPRPRAIGLRRLDLGVSAQHVADTHGRTLDYMVGPSFNPQWNDGSRFYVWVMGGSTRLDEGFDLSDRVPVPAGRYDTWMAGFFGTTSPNRPISFRTEIMLQGTYGGTVHSIGGEATIAPTPNLGLHLKYTRNLAELPGGRFTADLGALRLTLAASPRLVANALIQYNGLENTLAGNFRIRYTFQPGSDLFLVFNEQRGDETRLWKPGDRAALVKLTYLTRF